MFFGGYYLHVFLHVGQSVLLRGYTLGVFPAVGIVVPVSLVLYRLLFQTGILDGRLAILTALLGIVVFFRVALGAHRLARPLSQQRRSNARPRSHLPRVVVWHYLMAVRTVSCELTMATLRSFVRRRRFSTFVLLTFVLTWVPWGIVAVDLQTGRSSFVTPLILLGGFGPFLAAIVVAAAGGDIRSWLGNLFDVGAPLSVWVGAVLVPIVLYVGALVVFVVFGGGFDRAGVLPAAAIPAIAFATLVRGGLEEPGWRGLALPVLQRRVGAFRASLVIGVVWALWHVPLFLLPGSSQAGTPFALYAAVVVGISVIATWLYNAAGGRTLVAIVFHTLSNAVSVTTAGGVIGDEVASQVALLAVVWTVVAVLVWRYDTDRLSPNPLPDGGLDLATPVIRSQHEPSPDTKNDGTSD